MTLRKSHNSFRRLASMVLVLSMILSITPAPTYSSTAESASSSSQTEVGSSPDTFFDRVKLYVDGKETSQAELSPETHLTITAKYEGGEENVDTYTWQIYDPVDCYWLPISGSDSASLRTGAAMLSGMTNESGVAILNCKIASDGALYYSDTIQIKLLPAPEAQDGEAVPAAAAGSSKKTRSGIRPRTASLDDVSGGELVTHTVTVKFLNYITNEPVAEPYIAHVKHQDTAVTVYPDSPAVMGYTPYIITEDGLENGSPLTAESANAELVYEYTEDGQTKQVYGIAKHKLTIALGNVTEDITYVIMYIPNKVYYTVSHYAQNVTNDDYVLYYVETKQGYVGQLTQATDLTKIAANNDQGIPSLANGFTALTPFKNQEIAADGTTQITTYYDRLYYLMTFKLDSGRGTEPVYARYGASVHIADPIKTGYEFVGWVLLQMENPTITNSSPRPATVDGNYIYLDTDANGQVILESDGTLRRLTANGDGTFSKNDSSLYTPLTSDKLPHTMPAHHSAVQAIWKEADAEYTVIYWLENADHTNKGTLTKDNFDYWCAITLNADTGTNLKDRYQFLENPLLNKNAGHYTQVTNISLSNLNGQSFALVTNRLNKLITDTPYGSGSEQGLQKGGFTANTKTTEWTFEQVTADTFRLHSNGKYMVLATNKAITLTEYANAATVFKVAVDSTQSTISIKHPEKDIYVSEYGGDTSSMPIHGWEWDLGAPIKLYAFQPDGSVGTGASALTCYEQFTDFDVEALDQQSLAIEFGNSVLAFDTETDSIAGLAFAQSSTSVTAEWTFIKTTSGNNHYKLQSDNQYLRILDGQLTTTEDFADATVFQVSKSGTSNQVTLCDESGQWYISASSNTSGVGFAASSSATSFNLHSFTGQLDDPDAIFYYYYYSDFRALSADTGLAVADPADITVTADGKTVVNVYFRRREYNLRFFYARSSGEGNNIQYQVIGGSSYGFSQDKADTTDVLLGNIDQHNPWGNVTALPTLNNPTYADGTSYYTLSSHLNETDNHTYYYFVLKARYGQNIASKWPSEVMANVTRSEANAAGKGWSSKTAVFSAWNGEYWLKYSRDQVRKYGEDGANYTIKGDYQLMDEHLLYDPSYNPEKAEPYYERGTGSRYLDFVGFYENGADVSWSIPRQYHYYLWIPSMDQNVDDNTIIKDLNNLPDSDADFALMVENQTKVLVNGTVYVLYDKVDSCDNDKNPNKQTVPGIPGYENVARERSNEYFSSLAEALAHTTDGNPDPQYYYSNSEWDRDVYQNSYTLHYIFEPLTYNITLQSWNHIKKLDNIPYGSMDGANIILGLTEGDPGYMYDEMMSTYYPSDLPEGAYYFAGWYKTPDYVEGTMANFDKPMPHYNMMLYAKWVPKRFNVEVYQTSQKDVHAYYDDTDPKKMQAKVEYQDLDIHGTTIQVPIDSTGKGYGEYLPTVVPFAGPDKTGTISQNVSGEDFNNGTGTIRKDWIFVCYAYMKDGVEHAIDVSSFTISEDVQIYAKWTADNIVYYQVEYVEANLEVVPNTVGTVTTYRYRDKTTGKYYTYNSQGDLVDADGNVWIPTAAKNDDDSVKYVADASTGRANYGANRTFRAKTEDALYKDYRTNWFPLYASHTTLMHYDRTCDCAADAACTHTLAGEDEKNPLVTTFYYVHMDKMPYTVYYVDGNGNPMADCNGDGTINRDDLVGKTIENPKTGESLKMVVTENYIYHEGYTPDAFQKTLVLSANPAENVITFVYEKSNGTAPYTILYYYETLGNIVDTSVDTSDGTKNYRLHHELSGRFNLTDGLSVDYLDITGYEYAMDVVTTYTLDSNNMPVPGQSNTETGRGNKTIKTNATTLVLEDLRGHKITAAIDNGAVKLTSQDKHNHTLENSIFTYTYDGVEYRVKDLRVVDGRIVIDGYASPTGSFKLEQSDLTIYGNVIKVYYDLKYYPYYIIHKIDGGEELDVTMDIQKFQSTVSGKAWTEAEIIEKGWAGYETSKNDKEITITMTIQDDEGSPNINTITFLYYEKMMEFDYHPMLLMNSGGDATVVEMPENEPNAKINLVRDYIKSVTGTADAAQPVIYEEAFEFLGWFLDEECTKPVAASGCYMYLGTGSSQDSNGVSSLTGSLAAKMPATSSYDDYKQYDTLLPQKITEYQYLDAEGNKRETTLKNGVYVGAYNGKTYDQQEDFYALFVPKLGTLTITRTNLGPNAGLGDERYNQANSFVYNISGTTTDNKTVSMQVSLTPDDFVADADGNYSASVIITDLPQGKYEVTQVNDWSWRYSDTSVKPVEIEIDGEDIMYHTVVFDDAMVTKNWLSGFWNALVNTFTPNT